MSEVIRVVAEDLHVSAAKVEGHAEELHARHTAAHGRIQDAQAGVPAGAAAALSAAVAKWQGDTAIQFGKLMEHSGNLRGAEVGYTATESRSSEAIDTVGADGLYVGL